MLDWSRLKTEVSFGEVFSAQIVVVIYLAINKKWYPQPNCSISHDICFRSRNRIGAKAILNTPISSALGRCYKVLMSGRPEPKCSNNDLEGPVVFNRLSFVRVGSVRTSIAMAALNQIVPALRRRSYEIGGNSIIRPLENIQVSLQPAAVQRMFQALCLPLSSSHILTKKMSYINYSIIIPS
jgi:hypothetical protein